MSVEICGSSESVTRTTDWLAKEASARSAIAEVALPPEAVEEVVKVDSGGSGGLSTARLYDVTAHPRESWDPAQACTEVLDSRLRGNERSGWFGAKVGFPTSETSQASNTMPIDKTYQPSEVGGRISGTWEAAGAFRAGRPERASAAPYSIVIPPPNVTGSLHMGHALNNTLQDILCRFERMRGRDVLWQPGTDHAGIATQMVVERQLMERQQPGRREMGREKFLERVWQWKAESGDTIINQLKRLGASCDWSRERFTMDEGLSKAVVKVFVELHRDGLIYKDKRLVNWDTKLLTAISDLEVQQTEFKGSLWYLRYPIEGKTFSPEDPSSFIVVATTRPATMLGDTAVAVHPEDERYVNLIGKHVILPLVGRRIPIVADDYSDPEKGSGAVKVTPAHDFNDFEVGKRHNLPQISVFDQEGCMALVGNEDYLRELPEGSDE